MKKRLFPKIPTMVKAGEPGSTENPIIIDTEEKLLKYFGTPLESFEGIMLRPNSLMLWATKKND